MLNLGIDPGKTGGMALINQYGDFVEWVAFQPDINKEFDTDHFCDLILTWKAKYDPFVVWLEKVHSMPKQGVVSTFSFGKTFGQIIGVLTAYNFDINYVTPNTWTKVMHEGMPRHYSSKERSLEACQTLWPGLDLRKSKRATKAHDGIIDAMLIAEYGRRTVCEAPLS